MGVFSLLSGVANRLGLIRVVEVKDAAAPQKLTTRSITLADLTSEVRSDQVRALAELPAELSVSFEKVFEAAGVKPPAHGWTIQRLEQLVQTEQYKSMPREAAQQAILGLLATEKVLAEELVQDAIQRDKALDAFEGFVFRKMTERLAARQNRIAQIDEQIQALRQEQSRLAEETNADEEHWRQWHRRKASAEEGMALGYLLEKPIVSVDREARPLR